VPPLDASLLPPPNVAASVEGGGCGAVKKRVTVAALSATAAAEVLCAAPATELFVAALPAVGCNGLGGFF